MRYGLDSIFAASSKNALDKPSSSEASEAPDPVLRDTNSPSSLALLSAALAYDAASATGSQAVFSATASVLAVVIVCYPQWQLLLVPWRVGSESFRPHRWCA